MTQPSPSPGIEIAPPRRPRAGAEPSVTARWQAAERRLYPLVMIDAVGYEAAVTLVSEVAAVLREKCGTVTELAGADQVAILSRCPSVSVIPALGFDPDTAYDAACACRWRELIAEQTDIGPEASQDGVR